MRTPMPEAKSAVDQELIRGLAALLDETGLTEIEIERDGMRVRVARRNEVVHLAGAAGQAAVPPPPAAVPAPMAVLDPAKHPGVVTSPMVGTVYRAGEPGGRPFVDIGSLVKAGDTLMIVE